MSTALEMIQVQKVAAVETGATSESFTLDPDGSAVAFKGIFDDSHEEDDQNAGNVTRKRRSPAIMVASIPTGAAQGKVIVYADGSSFPDGTTRKLITYIGPDERGISILWLA